MDPTFAAAFIPSISNKLPSGYPCKGFWKLSCVHQTPWASCTGGAIPARATLAVSRERSEHYQMTMHRYTAPIHTGSFSQSICYADSLPCTCQLCLWNKLKGEPVKTQKNCSKIQSIHPSANLAKEPLRTINHTKQFFYNHFGIFLLVWLFCFHFPVFWFGLGGKEDFPLLFPAITLFSPFISFLSLRSKFFQKF